MLSRILVSALVIVATASVAAQAAPYDRAGPERPGLGRPTPFGKPSQLLVADLATIVAAQLAAKEQADTGKINPFSKPRPRPDREQYLFKRPVGAVQFGK